MSLISSKNLVSYTWSKSLDYQSGWFGAEVGDPHLSNRNEAEWFNTGAFGVPVLSYGNTGKNDIGRNCGSRASTRSTS